MAAMGGCHARAVADRVACLYRIRTAGDCARRIALVDISLFRQPGFSIGVAMALVFYMLSSFYLTFSVYLQGGLHLTPLDAGLRTLPFGIGYFAASFAAARVMQRLGPRALTLGFIVQVLGFGAVILAIMGPLDGYLATGLVVAGAGFGIVMPSVIKADWRFRSAARRACVGNRDLDIPDRCGARRRHYRRRFLQRARERAGACCLLARLQRRAGLQCCAVDSRRCDFALAAGQDAGIKSEASPAMLPGRALIEIPFRSGVPPEGFLARPAQARPEVPPRWLRVA